MTSELCLQDSHLWRRLFRAQWQDVTAAAEVSCYAADRLSRMVLRDVSAFLKSRGLEYFRGFSCPPILPFLPADVSFYRAGTAFDGFSTASLSFLDGSAGAFYNASERFRGFRHYEVSIPLPKIHGGWVR